MSTINGLPAHILLVHAIVVLLPLAATLLVVTTVWPAMRRRLAGPNVLLALAVLALVPVTTDAGEWLEQRVPQTPLLHDHTELGDTAVWVALPVAVLALFVWWRGREADNGVAPVGGRTFLAPGSAVVTRIVVAVAVVAAGLGIYDVYRIGDSGAKASWTGQFSSTPLPGEGRDDGD
ncbi:hypothetical protein ODJ79_37255 [Actinoplanes sp. KI2]|uniref:DUF2231 domain-containing protein n=1 Tax=Actinoplanes sp. KI2 TaxID=2983315 RepID=UPI0021D5EFD1|nr:DUF2231 domain-containing protein [Actinoplanes sp. KI2]MCU7729397.1 hypothetical protein [Actinoplanes sp. KI2]